jgi:hypothetical protein
VVDLDLFLEALHQQLGAFVVQAAPAHVDRLDLARRRGADRLVVAVADQEIVLHDAAQRREREQMRHQRRAVLAPDVEHQPVLADRKMQHVGPAVVIDRRERIVLDQVVDRDRALVLDVRAGAPDGAFVQRDLDEPLRRLVGGVAAHLRLSRSATERAWAVSPSASPSAIAAGPSLPSASGSSRRIEVRFMKSSTPRPDEKRAERAVGSTWLEPAT